MLESRIVFFVSFWIFKMVGEFIFRPTLWQYGYYHLN